jgi:hypothetical protein
MVPAHAAVAAAAAAVLLQERRICPELPPAVLAGILKQQDQQQRISRCASVSHSWRAAAAAATSEAGAHLWWRQREILRWLDSDNDNYRGPYGQVTANSLQRWLAAHDNCQLLKLSIDGSSDNIVSQYKQKHLVVEVPFRQLQHLQHLCVKDCHVRLVPARQQQPTEPLPLLQQRRQGSRYVTSIVTSRAATQAPAVPPATAAAAAAAGAAASLPTTQMPQVTATPAVPAVTAVAGNTAAAESSGSSSNAAKGDPLPYLTRLTALELEGNAGIQGLPAGLHSLSVLSSLQRLHIPNVSSSNGMALLWITQMQQLTSLELPPAALEYNTPAPFRDLQQLQQLVITEDVYHPGLLQDLPPSLTHLQLNWRGSGQLDSAKAPALTTLTAMQHLELTCTDKHHGNGGIDPQYLASMQQLRVLKLRGVHAGALGALLDAMPGLTQLEELDTHLDVLPLSEEQHAHYAAQLPPSPVLRRVALYRLGQMPSPAMGALPVGCATHLFAPGRIYPGLQELQLIAGGDDGYTGAEDYADLPQLFGPEGMSRLVAACPNLQSLWIPGVVQPGVDMSPLLQLTGLTKLGLAGEAVNDNMSHNVLRRLAGLQHLDLSYAEGLTDVGLLALTSRRQLTQLQTQCCGIAAQPLYHFHGDVDLTATVDRRTKEVSRASINYHKLDHTMSN